MKINALHRAVLQTYANQNFAYLADREVLPLPDIYALGDGLLTFLLIELLDEEGCDGLPDAMHRLTGAKDDIDVALEALTVLNDEIEQRLKTS